MDGPSLTLLGTGTSMGVPMVGCRCAVCRSDDPRDKRTRCGALLRGPAGAAVIDTPPELRLQLIREEVRHVDAALFTHAHADHVVGLDDLRICGLRADGALPLFCEEAVESQLRQMFHYAFAPPSAGAHAGSVPQYEVRPIGPDLRPFEVGGLTIRPLRLMHGRLPILGFRVRDVAYCTDVSEIPAETWPHLEGLDTLVVDALRPDPHPTHFHLDGALAAIERAAPKRAVLTHIAHQMGHDETSRRLPVGVEMGYDGLSVPV